MTKLSLIELFQKICYCVIITDTAFKIKNNEPRGRNNKIQVKYR